MEDFMGADQGRRKIELEELQHIEFEILKCFRDFCDKNGLRYYLCGGTLIGAIRHKGFIPWDDDIDVMMPRPDYMKFIELNKDGWLDSIRRLDHYSLNQNALGSVLRLVDTRTEVDFLQSLNHHEYGCWMDVYPIDGMNSTKIGRVLHCRLGRIISDLSIMAATKMGVKRRSKLVTYLQYLLVPFLPVIRAIGTGRFIIMLDKLAQCHKYEKCKYVGVLDGRALDKEAMMKSNMEPPITVEFWGEKFKAMANYDEYLTNLYGDYMTPPKEHERASRHIIEFYMKDSAEDI